MYRLAATADVLLENFAPGTIDRLGCGWHQLRKINPRLIYLSLKGYLAGPYENRGALDEVVQMQTGLAYMTGPPGKPLRMGAPIIDILGAVFGIVAVLAALRERERTGRGQRVSSALFESAAFLVGTHIAGSAVTGQPMPPMPARKGAWGVYDVFNTADRQQVFVAVTSDGHWQRFCDKFGFSDLAADNRLASNASRSLEREWLIPELESRLARFPMLVSCRIARPQMCLARASTALMIWAAIRICLPGARCWQRPCRLWEVGRSSACRLCPWNLAMDARGLSLRDSRPGSASTAARSCVRRASVRPRSAD